MSDSTARFLISGRVQGVGFRWFVRKRAEELGVVGWVRNLPDGSVEVTARGSPATIDSLETVLARGPQFARVENVERSDIPHESNMLNSFIVK